MKKIINKFKIRIYKKIAKNIFQLIFYVTILEILSNLL